VLDFHNRRRYDAFPYIRCHTATVRGSLKVGTLYLEIGTLLYKVRVPNLHEVNCMSLSAERYRVTGQRSGSTRVWLAVWFLGRFSTSRIEINQREIQEQAADRPIPGE